MSGSRAGPAGDRPIPHGHVARGTVTAPASKSVTQRALIAAAIASGRSIIRRPLLADDNRRLIAALESLGVSVTVREGPVVEVIGCGGRIAAPRAAIQVGNAGTTMRFLTALLAFGDGDYLIDGDPRMRRRPIGDLLTTLRDLGARAVSVNGDGCPPVRVGNGSPPAERGSPPATAASVLLRGDRSSQFLSAILLAAPAARTGVDVTIDGPLVSRPYVDLTVAVLRRFGVTVRCDPPGRDARRFRVAAGSVCRATDFTVEGDWSSASYFFAAAAITGGAVTVTGVDPDSAQGDARFLGLLERMGCAVERGDDAVTVRGVPNAGGPVPAGAAAAASLRGIDADCADMPDIVPTLAVVALFAAGSTRISGVPHLRIKETDRIAAVVAEIRRLGGEASETGDGLTIVPRPLRGARVGTYDDHRMAMAFAVAGLRVPGLVIADPGCVSKSFPEFWDRFESILRERRGE